MNSKNTYTTNKANSLRDKAVFSARRKIYSKLASKLLLNDLELVIDIGVTADKEYESSNFFEKLYPYPERITALSDQDASWMSEEGIKFVQGNALNMPFDSNTFDLVFSSAVIEHVGNRNNQKQFLQECIRISRNYVFITTPNRFYPIELHTALPFLHWLPSNIYRAILRFIGKEFYSLEENLNLLCKKDLINLLRIIGCTDYEINHIYFMGFKSNLLLMIKKQNNESVTT